MNPFQAQLLLDGRPMGELLNEGVVLIGKWPPAARVKVEPPQRVSVEEFMEDARELRAVEGEKR